MQIPRCGPAVWRSTDCRLLNGLPCVAWEIPNLTNSGHRRYQLQSSSSLRLDDAAVTHWVRPSAVQNRVQTPCTSNSLQITARETGNQISASLVTSSEMGTWLTEMTVTYQVGRRTRWTLLGKLWGAIAGVLPTLLLGHSTDVASEHCLASQVDVETKRKE